MTAATTAKPGNATGDSRDPSELVVTIERERALLDELTGALERQRSAVANDDVDGIEQGVHAVHRILFTLSEATARRRALMKVLGVRDKSGAVEAADGVGDEVAPELRKAIDGLADSARVVQEALEQTREMLRGAVDEGDALIKRLAHADTPEDRYSAGSSRRAGSLINHEV